MLDLQYIIYDDFYSRIILQDIIGTITPNCGVPILRNEFKIIEVIINNHRDNNYDKNKTSY